MNLFARCKLAGGLKKGMLERERVTSETDYKGNMALVPGMTGQRRAGEV